MKSIGEIEDKVVFPIHPRTRNAIKKYNLSLPEKVIQTNPLGNLDMLILEENAGCILTDSGGIQKEA